MKGGTPTDPSFFDPEIIKLNLSKTDKQIKQIMDTFDNIELLSALSLYENYRYISSNEIGFNVPKLSHITGLSLNNYTMDNNRKLPEYKDINELIRLSDEYYQHLTLLIGMEKYDGIEIDIANIIKKVKSRYLINLFNPSKYPFQLKNLVNGIFYNFDEIFYNKVGFTSKDALEYPDIINKLYLFNIMQKYKKIKSNNFKDYIFNDMKSIFVFNPIIFSKKIKKFNRFKAYLNFLSCEYDSSNNIKYENPFSENIIFIKPIIRLDSNSYFVPIPSLLLYSLPNIFEKYIIENFENKSKIYNRYIKTKSKFVEGQVNNYVKRIFPKKSVYKNLFYKYNKKRYELDTVVVYDNNIFFFESKSGNFSYKENDFILRIKSQLEKIVESAYEQGKKAHDYITNNKEAVFYNKTNKKVLKIKHDKNINKYFFISVTFEPLLNIQTNLKDLTKMGLFTKDEYPWSIYLFELDIITRYLKSPSHFIHYISNRLNVQYENIFRSMDEMGFFAFYLMNGGFRMQENIKSKNPDHVFLDFSSQFDDYYIYGKSKPRFNIQKEWLQLIEILEYLKPTGYTNIACELLNFDINTRSAIIDHIHNMTDKTRQDNMSHDFSIILNEKIKTGFTFIVEPIRPYLEIKLAKYCLIKKYELKADKWIGLGKDASDHKYYMNAFLLINEEWKKDPEMETAVKEFKKMIERHKPSTF